MILALLVDDIQEARTYLDDIRDFFMNPDMWWGLLSVLLKVLLILVAARLINRFARTAIAKMIVEKDSSRLRINARRSKTIGVLVENVITYAVNFLAILLILSQFNFDLAPLLAGAGVVGLAIGFGAQSIVKDIITGFFIIFEDQFAVGDVIQTGTYRGTVESIGLRVTTIRAWTGEIYILPNSTIQAVTNYSMSNSVAVIDLSFNYQDDVEKAIEGLKPILQKLYETNPYVVSEPVVHGIQTLGESNAAVRISLECQPNTRQSIVRELNLELERKWKDEELPRVLGATYLPEEKG
ncbi:mechanosensitive ion channel family protein [Gorillibacterium timonense]|uniref:mechanosensitive ion channel family protein n=1 Tax=Gorillibacterium timonense TaxID=1689269 RepID=UPI00071DE229|nr:mechanosensitive ion channel family protein [Gorillibacterium timonense]